MATEQNRPISEHRRRLLKTIAFTLASAAVPVPISAFAASGKAFDGVNQTHLTTLAQTLFPSAFIQPGQFQNSAAQLAARAEQDPALLAEMTTLLAGLPEDFADLDQQAREAALRTTEDGAALMALRSEAVNAIYRDPEVWKAIGYPGPSAPFGGYINRDLVDIDWLPEANR